MTVLSSSPVLSSSVVAGLVAGFVALRNSERKIQMENVTQERAKWREKIRIKSTEVHQAAVAKKTDKLAELHLEFSLNLNPDDLEDKKILAVIAALNNRETLRNRETLKIKLSEFSDRVTLLLKHDWERAKHEAKPWFFRWCSPKRINYDEWLRKNATRPAS